MENLKFDLSQNGKKFKILNATNGGPWHNRRAKGKGRSNLADYKALRIPYARNHDSALNAVYGGPYIHDITVIFPDFDADVNDPDSYDFACTDETILVCLEAGTETFFRLGQTIEHQVKKHGTIPPKDFKKWAQICEHIIKHYNEGWANGHYLNIQYWEIWNEPDLDADDSPNKRCWGGTKNEFIDFYEIAAKHLKQCFPNLKIGGPAFAWNKDWLESFLSEMQKRNVSMDFFSWHIYATHPKWIAEKAEYIQSMLDKYNFSDAENILDEWNYIKDWAGEDRLYSIKTTIGIKGAIFTLATFCEAQQSPVDMLMYYDTRPSIYNGLFDFYTYEKLKGYYSFYWYGMFYDMAKEIPSVNKIEDIFSLCGTDNEGKVLAVVAYYNEEDMPIEKQIKIDFGKKGNYEIYLLDEEHDGELVNVTDNLEFTLKNLSAILIKEI